MGNGGVTAQATSSCSNGRIYATVYLVSQRNNQYLEVRSAGLYDGNYGSSYYAQRANASAITPAAQGYYYAGARPSFTWSAAAPRYANPAADGDQVVFFVAAAGYPVLPVKVSCLT